MRALYDNRKVKTRTSVSGINLFSIQGPNFDIITLKVWRIILKDAKSLIYEEAYLEQRYNLHARDS